jgi:CheY-like chemotaxis protein
VNVKIMDTGIGIPSNMLQEIFEMFSQVDNSMERRHGGLGIGLTLVKSIVEMHGGTVAGHSKGLGKGSEFTVQLPLLPAETHTGEVLSQQSAAQGDAYNILVVDDNEASAKTLGWMLEMFGHRVRLAKSGTDALTAAKDFEPRIVFLDLGMPGLNGYEVCKQMRTEPALSNAVIVAQTGWGQAEHLRRSKEAGFAHHLVKPIDIELLKNLLAQIKKAENDFGGKTGEVRRRG